MICSLFHLGCVYERSRVHMLLLRCLPFPNACSRASQLSALAVPIQASPLRRRSISFRYAQSNSSITAHAVKALKYSLQFFSFYLAKPSGQWVIILLLLGLLTKWRRLEHPMTSKHSILVILRSGLANAVKSGTDARTEQLA